MSIRSLTGRLEILERQLSTDSVDLAAETALYGELVWGDRSGMRLYAQDQDSCAVLTIAQGNRRPLTYEVVGVSVENLR